MAVGHENKQTPLLYKTGNTGPLRRNYRRKDARYRSLSCPASIHSLYFPYNEHKQDTKDSTAMEQLVSLKMIMRLC